MAVEIIGKNGSIATMLNNGEGTALHLLARKERPNASNDWPSSLVDIFFNHITGDGK